MKELDYLLKLVPETNLFVNELWKVILEYARGQTIVLLTLNDDKTKIRLIYYNTMFNFYDDLLFGDFLKQSTIKITLDYENKNKDFFVEIYDENYKQNFKQNYKHLFLTCLNSNQQLNAKTKQTSDSKNFKFYDMFESCSKWNKQTYEYSYFNVVEGDSRHYIFKRIQSDLKKQIYYHFDNENLDKNEHVKLSENPNHLLDQSTIFYRNKIVIVLNFSSILNQERTSEWFTLELANNRYQISKNPVKPLNQETRVQIVVANDDLYAFSDGKLHKYNEDSQTWLFLTKIQGNFALELISSF